MSDHNRNALSSGHVLEGYRIEGVLGAGGFGITYLAVEVETGRRVAIKEYLPSGLAQRGERDLTVRPISGSQSEGYALGLERFREEARTLVQFRHPNIVWTLRFFQALGTAYLVMDYIEGESLAGVLSRAATLSEGELEPLIYPLLDGLRAVHEAGFLHRDVKPDNIYIRRDTGQPVLLDFGAARQALGQATHTLRVIVSHGYAPFEQYTSKREHGPWTDVYGLGATLYRCISGERPPAAPDRVDAIFAGKSDPLVPARELGQGKYSSPFLEAIDRALRPQPGERPQSVTAFKAILEGRSSLAAPATQQIGRSARRGEPMTLSAPTPGASSSNRSSPATLQVNPVLSPTVKVETPVRRSVSRSKLGAVLIPVLLLLLGGGGYYGYSEWQAQRERESAEAVRRQVEEHVSRARAAIRQGDFTDAERQLEAAAKLDRASASVSDARKALADAIRQRADAAERRRRALERVERARDALRRNEFAQADQAAAEAEQIDPAATNYATLKREIADARQRAEGQRKKEEEQTRHADGDAAQKTASRQAQFLWEHTIVRAGGNSDCRRCMLASDESSIVTFQPRSAESGNQRPLLISAVRIDGSQSWEREIRQLNSFWSPSAAHLRNGGYVLKHLSSADRPPSLIRLDNRGIVIDSQPMNAEEHCGRSPEITSDNQGGYIVAGPAKEPTQLCIARFNGANKRTWLRTYDAPNVVKQALVTKDDRLVVVTPERVSKFDSDGGQGSVFSLPSGLSLANCFQCVDQRPDHAIIVGGLKQANREGSYFTVPWIAEIDSTGQAVWDEELKLPRTAWIRSLVTTADGGFMAIVVMHGARSQTFNSFLVRFDAVAKQIWRHDFDREIEEAQSLLPLSDGSVIVYARWSQGVKLHRVR